MKPPYPNLSKKVFTLLPLLFLLFLGANAQSAVSSTWNFNNVLTATTSGHITGSSASLGPDIVSASFNSGTEYYGQDGWPTGGIDLNAYLQFTVTASSGYYLSLSAVALTIRRSNTGTPDGAGPNSFSLRSSLDNYASDIYTNTETDAYTTFNVTLPTAYQSIASTVTFRLYGYNTTINSGGNNRFVYDNIVVSGTATSGVLAEESIDLSAQAGNGAVDLQWSALGFASGTTYTVERSTDGSSFTTIGAASDATSYKDAALPSASRVFYRILAELPGGASYLSPIVAVTLNAATSSGLAIRAVAAEGSTVHSIVHLQQEGSYQLGLWSQDGKNLYRQVIGGQSGDITTDLSFGLRAHGIYILTVSGEGQQIARQFLY